MVRLHRARVFKGQSMSDYSNSLAEFNDGWRQATLPETTTAKPLKVGKEVDYQTVLDNMGKLNLTPDEQYKMEWGPDAISEEWLKGKAQAIQKEVENSGSIAVLRKGLEQSAADAVKATDVATAKPGTIGAVSAGGNDGNGGNGGDSTGTSNGGGSLGSSSSNNGMNSIGSGFSFGGVDAAKGAVKGALSMGLPGAILGGLFGGLSYTDNSKVNAGIMSAANAPGGFMSTALGMDESDTRVNNPSAYRSSESGGGGTSPSSQATGGDTAAGRTNDRGGYGGSSGGDSDGGGPSGGRGEGGGAKGGSGSDE